MALSYQSTVALLSRGHFLEIAAGTELTSGSLAMLSPEHRLMIAHALTYTGATVVAHTIAEDCNQPSASPQTRSRSELVLGLVAKRTGDLEVAIRHLQHAARLAREAGDTTQAAWSQLQLYRLLAEGHRHEVVSAALTECRRLVSKAGSPHLTAFLHDCVAVMEGQTGRLNEARRHLDIVRSILLSYPNAWLEQLMHTNETCAAILDCDVVRATTHSEAARRLSKITGNEHGTFVVELNDAHLDLVAGRFGTAFSKLDRLSNSDRPLVRVAALDGLARLHIALNRLDDCESVIKQILKVRSELALAGNYAARWVSICQAKLLIRRGAWAAAAEQARTASQQARELRDIPLLAALTTLEAEALAHDGQLERSAQNILMASEIGASTIRECSGHFYDTCHRVLALATAPIASQFSDRALRIWQRERNVWAQVERQSRGGPPLEIRNSLPRALKDPQSRPLQATYQTKHTAALITNAVGALLDLAFDPKLVAAELKTIAAVAGCGERLRVTEHKTATATTDCNRTRTESIAVLHSANRGSVDIRCTPSRDPLDNLVLSDILRIARAAGALAKAREEERNRAALWPASETRDDDALFVTEEMSSLATTARRVAPTNIPVLITGETGTGKEILARAIHAASPRANAIFLPFNCAGGPREMIDAQLFGHRRGAFTGATEHAPGVIRAAAGATLFLDEIGEAPLDVQPKLLRVLESGEIHPIGEPQPAKVDVRIIAATNVDLDAAVSSGRFREDLFYRLNIVRLHVPPLRERRVEIPVFAQHYLRKFARDLGKGDLRLGEETMEYLLLYRWPGNVRQLANEMRRLAALAETDAVLMPEHLSPEIVASRRTVPASERTLDPNEVVVRLDQPLAAATEHLERSIIQFHYKASEGRVEETARRLGLSRKGLYLKRLRLGLEAPEAHPRTA